MEFQGHQTRAYKVDVEYFEQCRQALDAVIRDLGKIEILCNNAGIIRLASLLEMDDDICDLMSRVNIIGAWNCLKAVLPYMMQNR